MSDPAAHRPQRPRPFLVLWAGQNLSLLRSPALLQVDRAADRAAP